MKVPTMLLFWIFMTALAFPLVLIATAAIGASIYAATFEQQETTTRSVFHLLSVSVRSALIQTHVDGPVCALFLESF